jgi:heme/copper-type cytochrome/quinol oxidase subunit 4
MTSKGANPSRSILSTFFTLVGMHGALAQIGVHLVFFLHLGSGPDDTNNILTLAFVVLVVFLVIASSIWIVAHLNASVMSMPMN